MARQLKTLPELALAFMAWELEDPEEREPKTQTEWCKAHDIPDSTPSRWRRSPSWKPTLENTQYESAIDSTNVAAVVESLRVAGLGGDTAAAQAYLRHVSSAIDVDDAEIQGMTDLELADALEEAAAEVRERAQF